MNKKKLFTGVGFALAVLLIVAAVIYLSTRVADDRALEEQAATPILLTKTYDNQDSRYSIKYPTNWEYQIPAQGTVVFSGVEGTSAYYATVNIQTVLSKQTGGDFETVEAFMADIKKQALDEFQNAIFLDSGPISLSMPDGTEVKGEFLTFTYDYNGIAFKQWQVVLLRNDEQVFYAWAYTSPAAQYEENLTIAQAMLKTWSIY
ncbi:hypothetical protein [Aquicella lusitana]|uniref:PsbP C-terminal domain-containing protein n=1 Tax=Aquicella lusitana TaxID=254246 RepID=A0A370G3U1_9COXI|nr:hypothetical protein [Aquicella lusitana]RDI37274.1 hypothetical protein C8D86_1406 [Aquicella lusitana]VVC73645.1 hypothetical protein AQULUS_13920 [Aquicella lusitana]